MTFKAEAGAGRMVMPLNPASAFFILFYLLTRHDFSLNWSVSSWQGSTDAGAC
jgi:hypothetical protein